MKLYQKYLAALLFLLFISIIYFYVQNQQAFLGRVQTVLVNLLNKQIEREKEKIFSFAFSLSQNETLQSAIESNDAVKAHEMLQRYMNTLETFSGYKVRTQIVSKDLVIFARSWDNTDAGLPIKPYRPDLQEMMRTREPHLSFEAARRLVLIASIPIIRHDELIGFMEVIQKFEPIENYFSNYDVDLLVLLDESYADQAILLGGNPRLDNTIVANDGANIHHVNYLKKRGIGTLMEQGLLEGEKHFYFSRAIPNSKGDNIGSFILIISKKKLELFSAFEKELDSFFTYARKDLYFPVIYHDPAINIYSDLTDKELLLLKKCVHKEDRVALEEKLREHLKQYSQDELISLLLDINANKKSSEKSDENPAA